MTTKNKIVLGIIGAAAAGVVIGMLVAPEKGKDMRKKIKQSAGDLADGLSNFFVTAKNEADELKQKAKSAKSAAEDKVSKVKESLS
ncbi:MAG TPA: YtxH domain-containing protein [Chitinophagaceae bacterium]|nr:YtxH domain-containing protein [Chitinophagaceae bacterium]